MNFYFIKIIFISDRTLWEWLKKDLRFLSKNRKIEWHKFNPIKIRWIFEVVIIQHNLYEDHIKIIYFNSFSVTINHQIFHGWIKIETKVYFNLNKENI